MIKTFIDVVNSTWIKYDDIEWIDCSIASKDPEQSSNVLRFMKLAKVYADWASNY